MAATPQSPGEVELMQRRKLLRQCVNTLLLMGASCATKVSLRSLVPNLSDALSTPTLPTPTVIGVDKAS
jgi:hypothetical protein